MSVRIDDFGAIGDGVADDAPALTLAVQSLGNDTGREVVFSPKTYLFKTGYVTTTFNVAYVGEPGATIKAEANVLPFTIESDGITIRGLTFLGDQSDPSYRQHLVSVGSGNTGAKEVLIRECRFLNGSSTCILIGADCSDITVTSNAMEDYYENAVDIVHGGVSRVFIGNNVCRTSVEHPNSAVSRPYGIALEPQSDGINDDWTIKDNWIDLSGLLPLTRNNTFGIVCTKATNPAINFTLRRYTISGNTIIGAGRGVSIGGIRYGNGLFASSGVIASNIIDSVRGSGIVVTGGEDAVFPDSLIVQGNSINGFSQSQTDTHDGVAIGSNLFQPVISGNYINTRSGENTTRGRFGVNVSDGFVRGAVVNGNSIWGVIEDVRVHNV